MLCSRETVIFFFFFFFCRKRNANRLARPNNETCQSPFCLNVSHPLCVCVYLCVCVCVCMCHQRQTHHVRHSNDTDRNVMCRHTHTHTHTHTQGPGGCSLCHDRPQDQTTDSLDSPDTCDHHQCSQSSCIRVQPPVIE